MRMDNYPWKMWLETSEKMQLIMLPLFAMSSHINIGGQQ
jgi:hypothetical protein